MCRIIQSLADMLDRAARNEALERENVHLREMVGDLQDEITRLRGEGRRPVAPPLRCECWA